MNYWSEASSVGKWLGLLAMAGVVGGAFSLWLGEILRVTRDERIPRYMLASASLGLFATCAVFLTQIGAITQAGFSGMFDRTMFQILLQSSPGYAAAFRFAGFAVVVAALLVARGRTLTVLLLASFLLLGSSFLLTGHVSTLSYTARAAIVLHVLAAFLWVGSLYPLMRFSTRDGVMDVKRMMVLFGNLAVYVVGLLLLSGIFLLTRTLGSFQSLFTTEYGVAFLAKLSGVGVLLGLAAANKFTLVPKLGMKNAARQLELSIRTEILVACFVLAVTAWLTTAVDMTR